MRDSVLERLRLGWIELASAGTGAIGSVRTQRLELDGAVTVVARLTLEEDCRGLILDIPVTATLADLATRSVLITSRPVEIDGQTRAVLQLRCAQPRLNEVFALLATGIVVRMCEGTRGPEAVVGAITEFRDLLRTGGKRSFSMEVELGLFGELTILERLLQVDIGAVRRWSGPLSERFDFRGPRGAIEVKTTRDRDFGAVQITSLDQLEVTGEGLLHLVAIAAYRDDVLGISVPELVERILDSGAVSDDLWSLLVAAGYDEEIHAQGSDRRFKVAERRVYEVREGFPRLTRASFPDQALPAGVHDVRYAVDLSHAAALRLDEADADALFDRFFTEEGE